MTQDLRNRLMWLGGILLAWSALWLLLGARFFLIIGAQPHPFLPEFSYTGVMLKAVAEWALHALLAHLGVGFLAGLVLFLWQRVGIKTSLEQHLGFRRGLWIGLGTLLWLHGLLFLEVPAALGMVQGFQHLPMGLALLMLLGSGAWATARGFEARWRSLWRVAGGLLTLALVLQAPHDLFRKMVSRPDRVAASERRLLILGIDGLRQDTAEAVMPQWKSPGGSQPVVAVPATRLTWNILLGADPETFQYRRVIPFRSELDNPPQPGLLNEAQSHGQKTVFLIDDSTTLSFGLSRTPFDHVYEPSGGWKHFFTVGAGTCWPIYSWAENYLSVVETTNPWSHADAFFRDVDRALTQHHWVSAHTCQLHAPFFLRRSEIQELKPWKWLLHPARAYQPYQALEQAEQDQFRRRGRRSNPMEHYRIRAKRILEGLSPLIQRWETQYPGLSGVLTSDHGEEFPPVINPEGELISYLTGMHGFAMAPDSLLVPLHPFGRTQPQLGPKDIYSWLDLRDDLGHWVKGLGPLRLTRQGPEGWALSFPTVQAVHTQPKEIRDQGGVEGAGIRPEEFLQKTYLHFQGFWFMDAPPMEVDQQNMALSWAFIQPERTVTYNPVGFGKYIKSEFSGYKHIASEEVPTEAVRKALKSFPGKRPGPWDPTR